MICPNCSRDLKRKERSGGRCSKCKRPFALDPKGNDLLLHDVRMRRLAAKLSDEGQYWFTVTQLRYAAARKVLSGRAGTPSVGGWIFFGVFMLFLFGVMVGNEIWLGAVGVLALVTLVIVLRVVRPPGRLRRDLPMSDDQFRRSVLAAWVRLYGAPPHGMIDEHGAPLPAPATPVRAALVCPDISVLACLAANGIAAQGVQLTTNLAEVPGTLPVLVLHDASVAGCSLPVQLRGAGARRVVDLGLRPSMVMQRQGATVLRGTFEPNAADWLRTTGGLTESEVAWLAEGRWAPIAAIPPAALVTRVRKAVGALTPTEPDERAAQAVGFLSWPAA